MHGAAKPRIMKIDKGTSLVRQGEKGSDVFLILDGVAAHRGRRASDWPSTVRERCSASAPTSRAATRTSSIVAVTTCRVASVPANALDRSDLEQLSSGHRREDSSAG